MNTLGRCNTGHKKLVKGFALSMGTIIPVFRAVVAWLLLELREGWRTWSFLADDHALKPLTDARHEIEVPVAVK